jgi:hypothetical protein
MIIIESSGYKKLKQDQQNVVNKAITKLCSLIEGLGDFRCFVVNNPAIHDSYGDFYVYKYTTKGFSVRLLYRCNKQLEIHRFHFKKGDRDNSKYIEAFEEYVKGYNGGK